MASHVIQGRTVTMPVEVRDATVCSAMYPVRADAARAVIAYSGLDVAEVFPGKAVCVLTFVDYRDGDLDRYHEFGMAFMVRPPGVAGAAGLADLRQAGVFIHWLPVDQGFTLEAGRSIWGFPKELADIELRLSSPYKRCIVRKDGRLVLDMLLKPGVPVPGPGPMTPLDAYTHRDGLTRRVPWSVRARGVRVRPGGALIRLGNHPVAKELSELGLPKRALTSSTVARVEMTFGDAINP
ncbi:acetoacetate decarboxylase family protein [Nonomuraea sp. SMC257]|uniref:Acetoacetate decarboxylase family protein n=1 Tax=Nonomuraea montanisoli TaxID=2741721 RepID=A0A7Y6I2V5_9ACTN|nr:acetoacetate decarboxylase family protein [Nonomuraea montanisoli]NUW30143.1 acetoacetate decarboxylase family protein [Nonomuraea montanisoli]